MGPAVSVAVATVAVAYAGERADGTETTVSSAKYLGTAPRSASSSCLSRPLFLVWVAVHVALALCEWMHSWWRGLYRVSVARAKGRALSHVLLSVNEDVDQDAERRAQQLRSLIMSVSWAFSVGARHVTVYDPHAWVVGAGSLCGVDLFREDADDFLQCLRTGDSGGEGRRGRLYVAINGRPSCRMERGPGAGGVLHVCGKEWGRYSILLASRRLCRKIQQGCLRSQDVDMKTAGRAIFSCEVCDHAAFAGACDISGEGKYDLLFASWPQHRAGRDGEVDEVCRSALSVANAACECALRLPEADMAINFGITRYHNDYSPWDTRLTEFFDAGDLLSVSRERLDKLLSHFSATHTRLGT